MIPELGAFGCVRTNGWVARAIRFVTRSKTNHAFVYVGLGRIVEAQPRGAIVSELAKYPVVHSWHNMPPGTRQGVADAAMSLVGTPYGFLDILSVGLLQYGIRPRFLRAIVANEHRLICSQLDDRAALLGGVHVFADGRLPQDVTPGDLDRLPAQL